uniref:Uncharacterized protein n=1 Tax=Arundo donax TaxID=35708 RepID=A0A0A9BDM9_ARUDO
MEVARYTAKISSTTN